MLEALAGDGNELQMPLCRFMKQLYTDISRKWDVLHLSSAADGAQHRIQDNVHWLGSHQFNAQSSAGPKIAWSFSWDPDIFAARLLPED